jgi:hypothetical protein
MKDHNGGDLPGTVLGSVNASGCAEMQEMYQEPNWYDAIFIKAMGYKFVDGGYQPLNAPASGITSQETLERAY